MNMSPRGFPLLWQGKVDVPIITLENYEKWYNIFVVFPDDRVETVPVNIIQMFTEKEEQLWADHNFHPKLLLLVAKHYNGEAHDIALEVAAGRWVMDDQSMKTEFSYILDEN